MAGRRAVVMPVEKARSGAIHLEGRGGVGPGDAAIGKGFAPRLRPIVRTAEVGPGLGDQG